MINAIGRRANLRPNPSLRRLNPNRAYYSVFSSWTPDHWLTAAALVGATVAFLVGLAQYRKAQQWKRAEWVAQEMKSLFDDELVQAAFLMIDWGARRIPLYPTREKDEDRYVVLTNETVAAALMNHHERPDGFTSVEADIRVVFDKALDGLERFHSYVSTGLVELEDLAPYLRYWALSLYDPRSPRPPEHRVSRLVQYMDTYGYQGAANLLKKIADANPRSAVHAIGQSVRPDERLQQTRSAD